MKKVYLSTILGLLTGYFAFAGGGGTIRGKITDENGEAAIGATIILKSKPSIGTTTDLDGNYSLKIPDSTTETIVIALLGYKTVEETILPFFPILIRNYSLEPNTKAIKEVQIMAKAVKAKEYYMEKVKINSATTIDYVSSETMKKTGDVNVTTAVARLPGVTTFNDGFITVRGMGDRFVKTSINGSRIPTLDPFTNNIKLDMFPAALVDNVILTKTASPDIPGDWAGAYISVETKDYPDQFAVNFETSVGYNSQTTGKDIVSSEKSSTDWLGYDSGLRDHSMNNYVTTNYFPQPFNYDEFAALGLANYFKSIGVTGDWSINGAAGEYYTKLGLIQLGLLGKAQINDANAFAAAKAQFDADGYHAKAYDIINAGAIAWNKSFADTWRTTTEVAPLNYSENFSIGNQVNLFGKPLGFIAGLRYSSAVQSDPNAINTRIASPITGPELPSVDTLNTKASKQTNSWSALFNLAYKFHPNHSISLLFMPNMTGVNKASNNQAPSDVYDIVERQYYESRKQMVYQLKSENYIPEWKMKIDGNASYTLGSSIAPDFKSVRVPYANDTVQYYNAPIIQGDRFFRYLTENIFDSRLAFEMPLAGDGKDGVKKLKFGAAYQHEDRTSDQYDVSLQQYGQAADQLAHGENSDPFSLDKFDPSPVVLSGESTNSVLRYYQLNDYPYNHSIGHSDITAGYAMLDYTIVPRLRIAGGARVEWAYLFTDIALFDSLHIPYGDTRRQFDGELPFNPAQLNQTSVLPSINMVYKVRQDEELPVNLRLNFSQTVARPSLRELSSVSVYDYDLQDQVTGNPDLKITQINNYDIRLESYFKSGNDVSLSLFYKDIINNIELIDSRLPNVGYFWVNNSNHSYAEGIEIEGKIKLNRHFEFLSNLTLVNSHSSFKPVLPEFFGAAPSETISHRMFGQAPYVVNGILSYKIDSAGLVVALSYNVQGPRIVIDGYADVPDLYELPRNQLDFKVSKSLGKHFSCSLKVGDILNAPVVWSYINTYTQKFFLDYQRYRWGTNYIFSLAYKI